MALLCFLFLLSASDQRPMSEMHGDCDQYALDLEQEFEIWAQAARQVMTGSKKDDTLSIATKEKINITLKPMDAIDFFAPPPRGKRGFAGSHGGMLRIVVEQKGRYKFCLGDKIWLDVVDQPSAIPLRSQMFEMQTRCDSIYKVVIFDLEPGREYFLQLAFSESDRTELLIFPE